MTYRYEAAGPANVLALDEDGTALAAVPGSTALVGLTEMPIQRLLALWERFQAELRQDLLGALRKTPGEFAEWHVFGYSRFDRAIITEESCIAFKRLTSAGTRLHYVRQPVVLDALQRFGALPGTTTAGKLRVNAVRGDGGIAPFCQSLPLDQQRALLDAMFADRTKSLDDVLSFGALPPSLIDAEEIGRMLESAQDAAAALGGLAGRLWAFDTGREPGAGDGEGDDVRRYAAPWFCAYLAREGHVLLPKLAGDRPFFPKVLRPFLWTFFVPEGARGLARHMVAHTGEDTWQYSGAPFRELALNTNFFRSGGFTLAHLLELKRQYSTAREGSGPGAARTSASQLGHGLNRLFEAYLVFHGKSFEDAGGDARFFGGGRRITSSHGRDAFSWVDNPSAHSLRRHRELVGEPPTEFPENIREWARELREVLPLFGVKAVLGKIDTLDLWLLYLIKVGEAAPRNWQEIDRERHINHAGLGTHLTYSDFLRSNKPASASKAIADLQKAWLLAATRDAFASKLTCPIDSRVDGARSGGGRDGRTRRKAVPERVFDIIVAENRRDGYAFARGLGWYERPVSDLASGSRSDIFWPALPVLLEHILTTGMRVSSAQWMDSGEGDEHWVDPQRVEACPNPLPSRMPGRSAGFLRVCQIGPREAERVLGMFIGVTKTKPHQVPWVDPNTAKAFVEMRDWQVRWNPRRAPVSASRDELDKMYAGVGTIAEVYPVFRDPGSRSAYPPTGVTIHKYWSALLEHCEPIVARELGYEEPLLVNGKPRWDLHSLRVTKISTLLENGVDPWIVAEFVGHASVGMTWHYKEVNDLKTHQALQNAAEERRRRAVEELQELLDGDLPDDESEVEERISGIIGGLVAFREDNVGASLLASGAASRVGYETFSHGLCPGGDCATGGTLYKNSHHPVFRPRACSRCRYRVTGPAFLSGLVHRLNSLMVEIKASMDKEADLNTQIEDAEDRGKGQSGAVRVLRGLVAREQEVRDELWAEWCAELATVRKSESMMDGAEPGSALPALTGMGPDDLRLQLDTVHQLSLMQTVLDDGGLILGASIEVPDRLRERRDALLLEVARNNDLSQYFYKLAPHRRRQALDRFGELLLGHVKDGGALQRLIDGDTPLFDIPALDMEVHALLDGGASGELPAVPARGGAPPRLLKGAAE